MATDHGEKSGKAEHGMRLPVALAGFLALVLASAWAALLFVAASRADVDPLGYNGIEPTPAELLTSIATLIVFPFSGVSAVLMFSFGVLRRGASPLRFVTAIAVTAVATVGTMQLLGLVARLLT